MIAEIRSDGAEPAPISRRHDAAPDSRIGFVRAPTACLAVPGVCLLRGGRSAPPTPGAFMRLVAPAPTSGPARPTPGVPFVSRRKEPKACRGCAPGPPEGGHVVPPAALPHPLDRVSVTNPDRFATLSWWANRSFFSPSFTGGHTLCCQSVARWGGVKGGVGIF